MHIKLNDVGKAQQIVSGHKPNFSKDFDSTFGIYMKSNERIECFHKYLVDRKKILSVIASSDQLLNAILEGTKEIDAFDISIFPKYLMYLKIGAIKGLSLEEYIKFFYDVDNSECYYDLYDKIYPFLEPKIANFWDGLIDYYDWYEIVNSTLFVGESVLWKDAVKQNKYLSSEEEYLKLRSVIGDVKINTYDGNFLSLAKGFKDSYDLIYLSNIIYYVDVNKYLECLKGLHLKENGIVLTYFYGLDEDMIKMFGESFQFEKFKNLNSGVLLFKK